MNIPYEMLLPALAAFLVSAGLSPLVIPFLKRLKFGQYVREEGPKEHYKKLGTPTMGGLIILASVVIVSGFYVRKYPELWPVLLVTVGFGMIGFLDDFIKIVRKRSMGLSAWQKLILQLVIAVLYKNRRSDAYSIFRWIIHRFRIVYRHCDGVYYAGNRQWSKLHRWSGRSGVQCDDFDRHIFDGGVHWT